MISSAVRTGSFARLPVLQKNSICSFWSHTLFSYPLKICTQQQSGKRKELFEDSAVGSLLLKQWMTSSWWNSGSRMEYMVVSRGLLPPKTDNCSLLSWQGGSLCDVSLEDVATRRITRVSWSSVSKVCPSRSFQDKPSE